MVSQLATGSEFKPLAVSLPDATRLTSLSRTALYRLMDSGQLKYVKIGRARRIPYAEVERLIAQNTVGTSNN